MAIVSSTILKTKFGKFKVCYHRTKYGDCVSFPKGNISKGILLLRIHSACLFGEVFNSLHCECEKQLEKTMRLIKKNRRGVIIYSYQEGLGIGLKKKIEAMEIQRLEKCDTVSAFKKLGFKKLIIEIIKQRLTH